MKKILSMALGVLIFLSMGCNVYVATSDPVIPLWDNIGSMVTLITFNGTSGNATASVTSEEGATKISATLAVYKQTGTGGWQYIGHTGTSTSDNRLMLEVDFTGEVGGYYKAVLNVIVVKDGIEEFATKTSYRTC